MSRYAWLLGALVWLYWLIGLASGAPMRPPQNTMALALTGLTEGYLEPCNCGGQRAGGLARRAAMVAQLRREHPSLVLIDVGDLLDVVPPNDDPQRLPVIGRTMAYLGVSLCALGGRDLARTVATATPTSTAHAGSWPAT